MTSLISYLHSWTGHSSLKFHNHPTPITLTSTKTEPPKSLLQICQESTPPCHLNPLLFNGHLQTIWTAMKGTDIPIYYKRRIFQAELEEYAGSFAVDFVVPPTQDHDLGLPPRTSYFSDGEFERLLGSPPHGDDNEDEKSMAIVLHGLSGGSHEIYLRAVLRPLIDVGWEACVVIREVVLKVKSLVVVKWARERWPKRKLFGIGFSLGANILTNYLGEEGEACLLSAAVVCSNPWNLEVGSLALQRTWLGREIYSKTMGGNMKRLFEKHVDVLGKNTRIDIEKVRTIKFGDV